MSEVSGIKKKKKNWSPDRVMSFSALFVSLISVIALFYQLGLSREENELIRKQQSASVLPHMRLSYSFSPERWEMFFINKGVGPAFIKKVEFTIRDTLKFQRSDFFVSHIQGEIYKSDGISVSTSTYSFMEGDVLSANDEIAILTINHEAGIKLFRDYLNSVEWSYTVIYEDVYGARWSLDGENDFPTPISND